MFSLGLRPLKLFQGKWDELFAFAREVGVETLELEGVREEDMPGLQALRDRTGVRIAAIASMNTSYLGPDPAKAEAAVANLGRAIRVAQGLGASCVGTFAGNNPGCTVEENVARFAQVFAPLVRQAEAAGVAIALENCPMVGGTPPVVGNLAYCPAHWTALFAALPSPALGLEFDVGHLPGLGLDMSRCLRDFASHLKHVHLKDAWVDADLLQRHGMMHAASALHGVPGPDSHLDFAALFRELEAVGYRGPVTLDLRPCTEEAVRAAAAWLKPLLAGLKST